MFNDKRVVALIPAAGMGQRMGAGQKKQYLKLNGKEILEWTLKHVISDVLIDEAIIIVPTDDLADVSSKVVGWLDGFERRSKVEIISGGTTRQESVFNGLCHVKKKYADPVYVVIHDGVRPFFPKGRLVDFLEVLKNSTEIDGAIAGAEVTDTLKRIDDNRVILGTVDRSRVWSVQTPQVFNFEALLDAHKFAVERNLSVTDDAALLEVVGRRAVIVPCPSDNIKITKPVDLIIAETLFETYKVAL